MLGRPGVVSSYSLRLRAWFGPRAWRFLRARKRSRRSRTHLTTTTARARQAVLAPPFCVEARAKLEPGADRRGVKEAWTAGWRQRGHPDQVGSGVERAGQGTAPVTVVPCPGADKTSRRPPAVSTR